MYVWVGEGWVRSFKVFLVTGGGHVASRSEVMVFISLCGHFSYTFTYLLRCSKTHAHLYPMLVTVFAPAATFLSAQ